MTLRYFTNVPTSELKTAYRKFSMYMHPDRGGSVSVFQEMKHEYEYLAGITSKPPSYINGSRTNVNTKVREGEFGSNRVVRKEFVVTPTNYNNSITNMFKVKYYEHGGTGGYWWIKLNPNRYGTRHELSNTRGLNDYLVTSRYQTRLKCEIVETIDFTKTRYMDVSLFTDNDDESILFGVITIDKIKFIETAKIGFYVDDVRSKSFVPSNWNVTKVNVKFKRFKHAETAHGRFFQRLKHKFYSIVDSLKG